MSMRLSTRSAPRSTTATWAPAPQPIVGAAADRGHSHIRLNDGNLVSDWVTVGQRRIWTAETDLTSAIAENIARDKRFDQESLLKSSWACRCPKAARSTARRKPGRRRETLVLPVVVKPSDGNHGRGCRWIV